MKSWNVVTAVLAALLLSTATGCVSGTLAVHSPGTLPANPTEMDQLRHDCEERIYETASQNNRTRTIAGVAELLLGAVSTLSNGLGIIGNTQSLHLGDVVTITTGALGTVTGLVTPVVAILGDTSQLQREHGALSDELDEANLAAEASANAPPSTDTTAPASTSGDAASAPPSSADANAGSANPAPANTAAAPGGSATPGGASGGRNGSRGRGGSNSAGAGASANATAGTGAPSAPSATTAGATAGTAGGPLAGGAGGLGGRFGIGGLGGIAGAARPHEPQDPMMLLRRCARGHSAFHVAPIHPPAAAH